MKTNSITGWNHVFKFSYVQTVKSKAFKVSTIIVILVIALLVLSLNFLPNLFGMNNAVENAVSSAVTDGDGNVVSSLNISTIYVLDESGITPAPDFSFAETIGTQIIPISTSDFEAKTAEVLTSTQSVAMLRITRNDDGSFSMLMYRPESGELVDGAKCRDALPLFKQKVYDANYLSLGVSADDLAQANQTISTNVAVAGEAPKSEIAEVMGMMVPMISSLLLFFLIFIYGQLVAQAIATEKTSRVMELLLTSIRPLAVIIGKVLAMGLVAITQITLIGIASGAVFAISAPFGFVGTLMNAAGSNIGDIAASPEITGVVNEISATLSGFTPISFLFIFIVFIIGFLFYALIAGLIGASVSRIEDLNSAMQPLAIIGVLGFYLAYMPNMFNFEGDGPNFLTIFARYFPISSPFALPSGMLLGEMSIAESCISILVLAVFTALMAVLVARVYESIILHSGNRLKIADILKLANKK